MRRVARLDRFFLDMTMFNGAYCDLCIAQVLLLFYCSPLFFLLSHLHSMALQVFIILLLFMAASNIVDCPVLTLEV
jgi:hypothetical protein